MIPTSLSHTHTHTHTKTHTPPPLPLFLLSRQDPFLCIPFLLACLYFLISLNIPAVSHAHWSTQRLLCQFISAVTETRSVACPMIIEKQDDTCNYMRCTFCKHEFCWVCLKHWPSDVYLGGMKLLPLHMLNYRKPCDCPQRTQSGHIANASK